MCDYSLHSVKNRLAVEGEQLAINKFHTGSKGLAAPADIQSNKVHWAKRFLNRVFRAPYWAEIWKADRNLTAVCVPHGARLVLSGIPKQMQKVFGIKETEEVTLIQMSAEPFRYRDAVQFDYRIRLSCNPHGACDILSLQNLKCGIRVEVLSLELEEDPVTVPTIQTERGMRVNA